VHQVEINLGKIELPLTVLKTNKKQKKKKTFQQKKTRRLRERTSGCPGEGIVREFATPCSHCYI